MKKKWSKALTISIVINILLVAAVGVLVLNKMGVLTRSSLGTTGYSYLSNPQYEANLSMFRIIDGDADVIFAGDSITALGRFSEFFPETIVMNRGIGSDTTEGLYNRIDEVISHHPKKLFIMIGINDMEKKIPVEESMKYYEMIISDIQQNIPGCKIYVESVLPTGTIDLSKIENYNTSLYELCSKKDVEYIDLYNLFLTNQEPNYNLFSEDKVHLNGNGYSIWIETVNEYVSE